MKYFVELLLMNAFNFLEFCSPSVFVLIFLRNEL